MISRRRRRSAPPRRQSAPYHRFRRHWGYLPRSRRCAPACSISRGSTASEPLAVAGAERYIGCSIRGETLTDEPSVADIRAGEIAVPLPEAHSAGIYFIGRIRTPWPSRDLCPRRGDAAAGPVCRIEIDEHWAEALTGIEINTHLQVLYWMHLARRDLVLQRPRHAEAARGTFALRSPMRPNPVASSLVTLVGREGNVLLVRGLDCIDGTPLVDVKPEACPFAPASDSDGASRS